MKIGAAVGSLGCSSCETVHKEALLPLADDEMMLTCEEVCDEIIGGSSEFSGCVKTTTKEGDPAVRCNFDTLVCGDSGGFH